ncbi:DUF3108 domain-containing protein [Litorimonas sp. WD9-15]|uniref:DUF3108 domain-containing protein n=1 Tax=Litorimonas sp. WD9-15 TaxID=3418716 RepID=UPI003D031D30
MTFIVKTLIGTTAALAFGATALSQVYMPDLLAQSDSFSILNEENFGPMTYTVPATTPDDTQIRMKMKGYVFGFRVIKSDYIARFDENDYVAYADVKSSGLAALLKKMEIWAVTKGSYDRNGLRPDWHVQQNTDKKNRRVEMNYDRSAAKVNVNIVPPLGSQGVPPATPRERYTANDTISGILQLMMMGTKTEGELCQGRVPFFDSKQHYNLRMERVGTKRVKFNGDKDDTIHCRAYYESVSGYDPEDLPSEEEAAEPVNVYFKYYEEAGVHIPVRFTYKISGFKAVVKVDELEIVGAE